MQESMRKLAYRCRFYKVLCFRCFIVFFVVECLLVNTIILYFFWSVGAAVLSIANAPGGSLIDKLSASPTFQNLIQSGKEGGFVSIIQHTLERVYVEQLNESHNESPVFGKLGVDVSGAGEALYIYRRLQKWQGSNKWDRLVIDIGANDGWMSSNSYNFIHWGWRAILIEPQASQLNLARKNLARTNWQKVKFLQAVIDDHDGFVNFHVSDDIVSMESHVVNDAYGVRTSRTMRVRSYSVKTFANHYNVPKHFGILSIDAEASSNKVLHQWISLGFRPLYILYESLHSSEAFEETLKTLESAGYTYLTKKGWNHIFELTKLS